LYYFANFYFEALSVKRFCQTVRYKAIKHKIVSVSLMLAQLTGANHAYL